jgi:murein DD-endopeptidase MepM/ murein hydrolase activator NlpD
MAAWYGGAAIRLYPHPGKPAGTHVTLIGVPYETPPRPDTVGVAWGVGDRIYHRDLPFRVVAGPYPSEEIRGVDQSRVTPGAEELARIARERELIAAAYVAARDSAMMDGPFAWPVEPRVVTSPYGTRRVFNGQLRSVHGGLDLRAREGTPIYAAQSGVVRLAQNLFYAGNHVLIEHGMGIHTSYSHLSKIEVEAGQWVEKGQRIGLAGATGRVTAAHLHWTVSVHGVGVSPLQCVEVLEGVYK